MKKKRFKHSLIMIIIIIVGFICLAAYLKIKQLQPDPNYTEFIAYNDHSEYIEAITHDSSIPTAILNGMVERANNDSAIRYGLFVHHLQVTSKYTVRLYFFIQYEPDEDPQKSPKIIKVEYANINRQDDSRLKQFEGKLSYNLEPYNQIYWELEGKFMNGDTTAENRSDWDVSWTNIENAAHDEDTTENTIFLDKGGTTIEYTANDETTYYHYLNKEGYINFQKLSVMQ